VDIEYKQQVLVAELAGTDDACASSGLSSITKRGARHYVIGQWCAKWHTSGNWR
jgi:hypothetical protein